jgi:hypothetical protein
MENCETSAHFERGDVAIQLAEEAEVVAADVEDLMTLHALVVIECAGQHLHRSIRTLKV